MVAAASNAELAGSGLTYSSDEKPGWRRRKRGRGFSYLDAHGQLIGDPAVRERIARLVIPPAWSDVWICPSPRGHLQATGRDERGRKQYIYHPKFRESRDSAKYGGLTDFAAALPALRRRLARDLAAADQPPDFQAVTAAIVSLLDRTLIRIGNARYASENGSYGLTTLQDQHVNINGSELLFAFTGKSGKEHEVSLRNRRLARLVRHCQELPGQELFQYESGDGELRTVSSEDVNCYLRETVGPAHSAKDFRTWAGTVLVASRLHALGEAASTTAARRNVTAAVRHAAGRLGNTLAVCRKGYVHPLVLEDYLAGTFVEAFSDTLSAARESRPDGLRLFEAATLGFLTERQPRAPRAD